MFGVETGEIAAKEKLNEKKINAIINAANPTLMGSEKGVDGNIHKEIDRLEKQNGFFKEKIREKVDGHEKKAYNTIRCQRGQAVTTSGYGLCDYVIHVVGTEFDGKSRKESKWNYKTCSFSRVQALESCYYAIVEQIKSHGDIERIAVPIISAGTYGFPFCYAAKIAVASMGNALIEWKQKDPELFALSGIKQIWFYIHKEKGESAESFRTRIAYMHQTIQKYGAKFRQDKKVSFQSSWQSNFQVMQDVKKYDERRGYFAIARSVRYILTMIRMMCLPWTSIKDLLGGCDWKRRRQIVEWMAFGKILLPVIVFGLVQKCGIHGLWLQVLQLFIIYSMTDTLTYLLSLIIMADVQSPSANIIRSCILLFVNYLEVSVDMAFLCFTIFQSQKISVQDALAFGILGEHIKNNNILLSYGNAGIKFFFLSLVVGYFAGHMKQRRFRS
ncbi:macro domain-containing protein [Eubacterium sp. An11]|uniref:macro domain-containing protein n=1 Tax=Eubacterium sp. An11 TaxID=1965542 RepID=UPI0013A61BAD|nr:macro domain-containing protein [Eubacterium sp. An11]